MLQSARQKRHSGFQDFGFAPLTQRLHYILIDEIPVLRIFTKFHQRTSRSPGTRNLSQKSLSTLIYKATLPLRRLKCRNVLKAGFPLQLVLTKRLEPNHPKFASKTQEPKTLPARSCAVGIMNLGEHERIPKL